MGAPSGPSSRRGGSGRDTCRWNTRLALRAAPKPRRCLATQCCSKRRERVANHCRRHTATGPRCPRRAPRQAYLTSAPREIRHLANDRQSALALPWRQPRSAHHGGAHEAKAGRPRHHPSRSASRGVASVGTGHARTDLGGGAGPAHQHGRGLARRRTGGLYGVCGGTSVRGRA